jgi:uncharacterized protein YunC (DUF1805 family)
MLQQPVHLQKKTADGYAIPLGPVNLVFVKTENGLVGCGAIDVVALEKFGYPAARVRPAEGPAVVTISDLLAGIVKEVNPSAAKWGIKAGMTGKEALERL